MARNVVAARDQNISPNVTVHIPLLDARPDVEMVGAHDLEDAGPYRTLFRPNCAGESDGVARTAPEAAIMAKKCRSSANYQLLSRPAAVYSTARAGASPQSLSNS